MTFLNVSDGYMKYIMLCMSSVMCPANKGQSEMKRLLAYLSSHVFNICSSRCVTFRDRLFLISFEKATYFLEPNSPLHIKADRCK